MRRTPLRPDPHALPPLRGDGPHWTGAEPVRDPRPPRDDFAILVVGFYVALAFALIAIGYLHGG